MEVKSTIILPVLDILLTETADLIALNTLEFWNACLDLNIAQMKPVTYKHMSKEFSVLMDIHDKSLHATAVYVYVHIYVNTGTYSKYIYIIYVSLCMCR